MRAIEIILSIGGFLIVALSGALWWFIRKQITLCDKDREAILRGYVDTVLLKKEIQAIHKRFDDLMELLREKLKII